MESVTIRPADQPGDLGWIVQAHGEMYSREFGWSTAFEEMVAEIVGQYAADHDPDRELAWIAEVDGRTSRLHRLHAAARIRRPHGSGCCWWIRSSAGSGSAPAWSRPASISRERPATRG